MLSRYYVVTPYRESFEKIQTIAPTSMTRWSEWHLGTHPSTESGPYLVCQVRLDQNSKHVVSRSNRTQGKRRASVGPMSIGQVCCVFPRPQISRHHRQWY